METTRRWQDWASMMFGIWLFLSPWILSFSDEGGAAVSNSYLMGILVTVVSIIALNSPRLWEERVNLVIGVWLIIAPFVLGFNDQGAATWNHVVIGLLIVADAALVMFAKPTHTPITR